MKTISIILVLLSPTILYPQNDELDYSKHGIFAEFEGGSLNQLGYRYRFSLSNSIAFYLRAHLYEIYSQPSEYSDRNTHEMSIKICYEHSIYRNNSVRCFLTMGLGYRINTSENTIPKSVYINNQYSHSYDYVNHNYSHTQTVVGGIGGEYNISKNLSVFIHQNIELESNKQTDKSIIETSESKRTEINIADVNLGLTIYF